MCQISIGRRPQVKIFHFGYELLNWASDPLCKAFGLVELFGPRPDLCPDVTNVTCMTQAQATWLQTNFIDEGLAKIYRGNPMYVPLNLLGTLQAAAGVPGARVGAPVWGQYTPAKYVRNGLELLGCVHLTPEGYTVLYEEMARHVMPHLSGPSSARRVKAGAEGRGFNKAVEAHEATEPEEAQPEAHAEQRPCLSDQERQCWVVVKDEA